MELQPTIDRLNEAVRGARTAHGKPLDIVWLPAEGGYTMRVVTWSDDRKTIEDVWEYGGGWNAEYEYDPVRFDAFVEGLRSVAPSLDPDWLRPGGDLYFPSWPLLQDPVLDTATAFAAAMATAESRVASIARGFAHELCADRGLPALSPERALRLFYLDSPESLPEPDRDSHEAKLAEVIDAVGADAELHPHALALLERWAEHGFASYATEDGEPLVPLIATRLYRLLVTRLTGPALDRLDRLLHLEPIDAGWPTPYRLIDLDAPRTLPTAQWRPPVQY